MGERKRIDRKLAGDWPERRSWFYQARRQKMSVPLAGKAPVSEFASAWSHNLSVVLGDEAANVLTGGVAKILAPRERSLLVGR